MGHTNSTANLALPQFIGTDKPTWLSDVNGAFAAIDTYAGNNDAALAITDAKADTAIGDAASAVTTAGNAATTAGNAAATATAANTVAGNALTVANGINSKVGVLTDLTTTDKSTVVNAINEVNGKDAGDIAYDNTGSGLTATNVQAAIDEVAQGGGGGSQLAELWTNSDPENNFAGQPVTVTGGNNYDELVIEATNAGSTLVGSMLAGIAKSKFAETGLIRRTMVGSTGTVVQESRTVALSVVGDDVQIVFGDGTKQDAGSSTTSTQNNLLVPIKVIGIKF